MATGNKEKQNTLKGYIAEAFSGVLLELPDHAWRPFGATFRVSAENSKELFQTLRDDERFLFNMLVDVTAVDWMDKREPRFDVVYQLLSLTHLHRISIVINVDEDNPSVKSVRGLWPAAFFLEREVWDMFGIKFEGHGDLRRILLYEEFEGHPLRKDYPKRKKQPRIPLRLPEERNNALDMIRPDLVALPTRTAKQLDKSKAGQKES